jgi:hypothetical protein
MSWVVMWNLPGCLPEMEPMSFGDWNEAHGALLAELERIYGDAEDEYSRECREALQAADDLDEIDLGSEWHGKVEHYCYSLTRGSIE